MFTICGIDILTKNLQEGHTINTSTGDIVQATTKIRDILEKEMEEKALLESGSDLPEELRMVAQVEADTEDKL